VDLWVACLIMVDLNNKQHITRVWWSTGLEIQGVSLIEEQQTFSMIIDARFWTYPDIVVLASDECEESTVE